MPIHEGLKPNQPFVVSQGELSSKFRALSEKESAKFLELEPKSKEAKKAERLSMEQAEAAIGPENFFGPDAVEKAFGIQLEWEQIPDIPFAEEELQEAKKLGQFLILRTDRAPDNQPLTMLKMHEILQSAFTNQAKGKVLYDTTDKWKVQSDFFTKETPRVEWALTTKLPIDGSKGKNYLEQTTTLVDYLGREIFKFGMPKEYDDARKQFYEYYEKNFKGKKQNEIDRMLGGDQLAKYAKELSELKINQLARQSPAEALYDMLVYFQNTGSKILEKDYTWTNRLSSDGKLVGVGWFTADGAYVPYWRPDRRVGGLGVSFSRSR